LNQFWNGLTIGAFRKIPTYLGSFTFLAIQYDGEVGSPPAHRHTSRSTLISINWTKWLTFVLHRLQELTEHLYIFVFRFKLPVFIQGS
jgi:hypothetical protein